MASLIICPRVDISLLKKIKNLTLLSPQSTLNQSWFMFNLRKHNSQINNGGRLINFCIFWSIGLKICNEKSQKLGHSCLPSLHRLSVLMQKLFCIWAQIIDNRPNGCIDRWKDIAEREEIKVNTTKKMLMSIITKPRFTSEHSLPGKVWNKLWPSHKDLHMRMHSVASQR